MNQTNEKQNRKNEPRPRLWFEPFDRIRAIVALLAAFSVILVIWKSLNSKPIDKAPSNTVYEPKETNQPGKISTKGINIYGMNGSVSVNGWNQLGSNAIAILAVAIQTKDTSAYRSYASFWSRLPNWLAGHLPHPGIAAGEIRLGAIMLVANNQTKAKPLIPYLLRIIKTNTDANVRESAIMCLSYVAENDAKTISILTRSLNDVDVIVRDIATNTLRKINPTIAAKVGIRDGNL